MAMIEQLCIIYLGFMQGLGAVQRCPHPELG